MDQDPKPSLAEGITKMIGGVLITALSAFGLYWGTKGPGKRKLWLVRIAVVLVALFGLYSGSKLFVSGVQETQAALSAKYIGIWEFTAHAPDGRVLWHEVAHNALVDVGEQRLLEIYFRDASEAGTTQFYISLSDASNPCSIAETDSLATANTGEPSTNGYARQLVERSATGWPTSALDAGDWQLTSSTETFSASGGSWGPVNCAVLQTTSDNTGDHVAFVALSQARTLASGESLDVSIKVKLQ